MEMNESMLRSIIEKVLEETLEKKEAPKEDFVKHMDQSGIFSVESATVKCEPFAGVEGVFLKDVTTLDESPRMGAGVMEIDHSDLEWTLTYDEYDVVLEGDLEIEIDGRAVKGGPGDIVYIPKGSHIHFRSPNKTRYAYFVYPANWWEQK